MQFGWTNLIYMKGKLHAVNLVSPRTGRAYTVRCGPGVEMRIDERNLRDSHVVLDKGDA
jgi:hypothetical protein